MRVRRGVVAAAAAWAVVLALPAAASAHAVLERTVPSASGTVNTPPKEVALTFSEAVEPRFAIVSVTDAAATQETSGPPRRSASDPDTLLVPLKKLSEGWYLVFWRAISVDGHPVRGAFTFAVGPNPGPPPQFVIPSISETAATPQLVVARAISFFALMAAIGLFCLRMLIARPMVRRVPGTSVHPLTVAFASSLLVALVAIPVYVEMATAQFRLRSVFDVGSLVPLMRVSAFGRGFLDLELCLGLFAIAGGIALWLDRPGRERRSIAELLSLTGALGAAAACLLIPGLAGHPGQTSPRGAAILFDWTHLAAGSVWVGGLIGLLVLWRTLPAARRVAGLVVCVPRFSNVALVSVLALVASGTGAAILHLPTLASLWETSYGKTLIAKIALLCAALLLAQVNLLRTTPRLKASRERPDLGPPAALLLRRLVTGEVLIVAGAVTAAALLTSLAPPAKALAKFGGASAHVGPGRVVETVEKNGYKVELRVTPNKAAVDNRFYVRITRDGKPVTGARVTETLAMLDMEMGEQAYLLPEVSPGVYAISKPALVMVGHWGLSFAVEPKSGQPFDVLFVDRAGG